MRRNTFHIAAGYMLALVGVLLAPAAGAAAASKEKVIYSFTGGSDGANPISDLVMDAAGNLYGTASGGGSGKCGNGGCGTVFELTRTKDGWKEQVLYSFTGYPNDGEFPQAGLIFDSAGNLYGTTTSGGSYYGGTVFKLSPNSHGGWTETVLYDFHEQPDGWFPAADLVFDDMGNLYGTASQGGSGGTSCFVLGCGTVFELSPQADGSWTETTIHVFDPNSSDGAVPSSGVVLDSAGNVYGMTLYGGTGSCQAGDIWVGYIPGCGTIYELTPSSGGNWTETIPYNFVRGGGFAVNPSGGIFFDNASHLYGSSLTGGDGFGTVFELYDSQKNGWQQRNLHIFYGNPDGANPTGRLGAGTEGDLFGVTSAGGAETACYHGCGTVFELKRSKHGWQERVLHSFGGAGDGATPRAGLVLDSRGHLYGTTQYGGSGTACTGTCGTVYEVIP